MNFPYILSKLKQFPFAVGLTLFALILAIILFFRAPLVGELQNDLATKQGDWDKMDRNIRNSRGLEQHLEQLNASIEQINNRLMLRGEVAINTSYFYQIEGLSGVSIVSLSQTAPFGGQAPAYLPLIGDFDIIGYNISVDGSFDDIMRFLRMIETGKHFSRLESLSLSRGREQPGTASVSATLSVFFLGKKS